MRVPLLSAVMVLGALGAACNRTNTTDDANVVRTDSAGVKIITSGAEDRELAWRFEQVSALRDSAGETMLFESMTGDRVVIDRAGRTYVLVSDPAILRYTRDGVQDLSIGREGSAPGEMRRPRSLGVQGDSLVVFDTERDALVRYGSTFEPITDLPLRDAFAGATQVAFRAGGVFIERQTFVTTPVISLYADTGATTPIATITEPRGASFRCTMGQAQIGIVVPTLFAPAIWWNTSSGRMLVNATPRYEISLYDGPRLIASIRRSIPTRAPTAEDVPRLYPDGFKLPFPGANCAFTSAELAEKAGLSDTLPLVNGVVLLSDGTIWIRRSFPRERPVVLDVFGSDGAYAGTIRNMSLPAGRYPNGDLLIVREDTASGGQHLVRYRVTK